MPAAPNAFFITREEPSTVPVTLWTTDPAPGINPIILFSTLFFAASKEGAIIVSNRWNPKKRKKVPVHLLIKKEKGLHIILKYFAFLKIGLVTLIEDNIVATEEKFLYKSSLKAALQ